jgi:hypothetical protein
MARPPASEHIYLACGISAAGGDLHKPASAAVDYFQVKGAMAAGGQLRLDDPPVRKTNGYR